MSSLPKLLDVVALLEPSANTGLSRGQVGTVVEDAGGSTVLVEFSDDEGQTYAVRPVSRKNLLVLRYVPQAA